MSRRRRREPHRDPAARPGRAGSSQPAAATASAARSSWLPFAAIFIVALAVRIVCLGELHASPVFALLMGDGRQYDAWAQRIAAGEWLGTGIFYQTPLYPYLLAILFKIAGHHLMVVRIVQAALGSASCVLVASAGMRFFNRAAGLAAGSLLALYPPAIFFDCIIQKSSLDLFLFAAVLAILGRCLVRPYWTWVALAGAAVGAFMINRENARVLYPIIVIWLGLAWRGKASLQTRALWIGAFSLAAALVLLPVAVRNYHVGGQFVVSTSQLGPNLFIGNHPGASGIYEPLVADRAEAAFEQADAQRLAEGARGRKLTATEVSDYWTERAVAFMRGAPGEWLALMGRKVLLTLGAAEIADTESVEAYAAYAVTLRVLLWFHFGILFPLAVFGAWQTRGSWRRLSVLYAMGIALVVAVAVFYVMGRYRYPLVPIVVLFAGAALAEIRSMRGVPGRSWVAGAALALLVAVPVNALASDSHDSTFTNLGAELTRAGRLPEATWALERAVAKDPNDAEAHYTLGVALNKAGDKQRAIDQFASAVRLRSGYVLAESALALTLDESGRADEALPHFRAAVRARPDWPEGRCNLAQSLARAGQFDASSVEFREALRLKPDDAKAHAGLGSVLQQRGGVEEAIAEYDAALRAEPNFAEAHSMLSLALAEKGDMPAALSHLREAMRLQPDNFGILMNCGALLARMRRTTEAIATFERALAVAQGRGATDAVADLTETIRRLRSGP